MKPMIATTIVSMTFLRATRDPRLRLRGQRVATGTRAPGRLTTPHGDVETPTFMPVGTQGSVKTLPPGEVAATGARIVLGNTYHLWRLRPGRRGQ